MAEKPLHHLAILAPVPLRHIISGEEIARTEGFVAYGTMKWELFEGLDATLKDSRIAVLLYPSKDELAPPGSYQVSWFGWYEGSVRSRGGAHPQKGLHRPPTTFDTPSDNEGHWALFWHVSGLRELPAEKRIPIGKLKLSSGTTRKHNAPHGPELVEVPEILSYES